jgi:hypothetical protein
MPPPPVPVYRSEHAIVDVPAPGRVRIRGTTGDPRVPYVDVDSHRVVTARAGQEDLFLGGPLQPYTMDRMVPNGLAVGPFSFHESHLIANALRSLLKLPRRARETTEAELRATPEAFHGQMILTRALWRTSLERSDFAGAWLRPPPAIDWPPGPSYIQMVVVFGLWQCEAGRGYGHFGGSPAACDAYTIDRVDP